MLPAPRHAFTTTSRARTRRRRERPKFFLWNALRQRHLVGLRAVEILLVSIQGDKEILRPDAAQPHAHRRRDAGDAVEEHRAGVQGAVASRRKGLSTLAR